MKRRKDNENQHIVEKKSNSRMRRLMVVSGCILSVAAFAAGGLTVLGISGKYNLKGQTLSYAADIREPAQAVMAVPVTKDDRKDGWVRYEGKSYSYNEDTFTFLFMGIDKEKSENSGEYADGGQADALFLLVLNPHEKAMTLIPINRSTMTAVDVYDEQGVHKDTVTAQICVQHGFGDGGKESCEYQTEAVRNLFYGIPIHGYLAVDMDAISEVTDLIEGIDLEILENVRNENQEVILTKGQQAHLDGEEAYWYVRDRASDVELSAEGRMERQRQFVTEFIDKVKRMTKKDVTVPVKIYNSIADKAVTDITVDEVAYLAATAGGYHFDTGQVVTIPGKSISGEASETGEFDEFYVDENGLYELILDVFYEPADEE